MATFNSTQMAKLLATPVQHVRSDEHGRVRRVWFAWEDATLTPAAADIINLCRIPPAVRVMGGKMFWEANTATATLDIGISGATTKYSGANSPLLTAAPTATPAAGGAGGRDLVGVGTGGTNAAPVIGEVTTTAVTVIGTVGVATLTANKRICGYLDYIGNE